MNDFARLKVDAVRRRLRQGLTDESDATFLLGLVAMQEQQIFELKATADA